MADLLVISDDDDEATDAMSSGPFTCELCQLTYGNKARYLHHKELDHNSHAVAGDSVRDVPESAFNEGSSVVQPIEISSSSGEECCVPTTESVLCDDRGNLSGLQVPVSCLSAGDCAVTVTSTSSLPSNTGSNTPTQSIPRRLHSAVHDYQPSVLVTNDVPSIPAHPQIQTQSQIQSVEYHGPVVNITTVDPHIQAHIASYTNHPTQSSCSAMPAQDCLENPMLELSSDRPTPIQHPSYDTLLDSDGLAMPSDVANLLVSMISEGHMGQDQMSLDSPAFTRSPDLNNLGVNSPTSIMNDQGIDFVNDSGFTTVNPDPIVIMPTGTPDVVSPPVIDIEAMSATSSESSGSKHKKRKKFSPEQQQLLRKTFVITKQPTQAQLDQLAGIMGLKPSQVNRWFEKKRKAICTNSMQASTIINTTNCLQGGSTDSLPSKSIKNYQSQFANFVQAKAKDTVQAKVKDGVQANANEGVPAKPNDVQAKANDSIQAKANDGVQAKANDSVQAKPKRKSTDSYLSSFADFVKTKANKDAQSVGDQARFRLNLSQNQSGSSSTASRNKPLQNQKVKDIPSKLKGLVFYKQVANLGSTKPMETTESHCIYKNDCGQKFTTTAQLVEHYKTCHPDTRVIVKEMNQVEETQPIREARKATEAQRKKEDADTDSSDDGIECLDPINTNQEQK